MKNRKVYMSIKRAADVCGAGMGILVTFPLWVIAAVGIEVSDPGPVFYKAHRIGKDNREFVMYKFRSMRVAKDADEKSFKADTDRIFGFGEWIRRMKIDELPQLINILNGDMSIVGPRPAAVDQVEKVRSGRNRIVSKVQPGLTGPSALYDYLYGDTIEDEKEYEEKVLPDRLELDIYYIKRRNLLFDLNMIVDTILCIAWTAAGENTNSYLEKLRKCAARSRKRAKRKTKNCIEKVEEIEV